VAGEEAGPPSSRGINWGKCQYRGEGGKCACDLYPSSPGPLRLGDYPSFYRPRMEQFTCVPHYSPTCGGVASSAAELMTILANLAPVRASWRVLCSYRGDFEGSGVEAGCPAAARGPVRGCRQRGSVRGKGRVWRHPVPVRSNSVGDVVAVPGVALQWRGWPHRTDSDGEDHSRWPDVTA
jgi:hypothetical protein